VELEDDFAEDTVVFVRGQAQREVAATRRSQRVAHGTKPVLYAREACLAARPAAEPLGGCALLGMRLARSLDHGGPRGKPATQRVACRTRASRGGPRRG